VVRDIFQIIKTLNEKGVTILLVEQNVRQALNIADRGYLLGKGRIIAQGTGKELLESKVVREEYLGLR
jgi:branched-chain amino acid transport system ATP-binding protein